MKTIIKILILLFVITSCNNNPKISDDELNRKADSAFNHDYAKIQDDAKKELTKWKYETQEDQMSSDSIKFASIISTNHFNLDTPYDGGTWMKLIVRKSNNGLDVYYIATRGQITESSYENKSVEVRFDEEKSYKVSVSESTSGSSDTRFISHPKSFLKNLKTHKNLKMKVTFYDQGSYVFDFNIADLHFD